MEKNTNTNTATVGGAENFVINNQQAFITNSPLRYDENKLFDEKLIKTAQYSLSGIGDLRDYGLVKKLPDIGVYLSVYERVSEMTEANATIDGRNPSEYDRLDFDLVTVPVPVFSKDWVLSTRELDASRRSQGSSLESAQLEAATRAVAEKIEDTLFNGLPNFSVNGASIYGYTTHPNRSEVTLAGTGWATAANRDIIGDVEKLLNAANLQKRKGPFLLYVAHNIWSKLFLDYSSTKSDRTFIDRIKSFPEIREVKPSASLANGHVILVQMTSDVVDLALAQDIKNIFMQKDYFEMSYKVYGIMVPRVKSDINGSCGVIHGKPA